MDYSSVDSNASYDTIDLIHYFENIVFEDLHYCLQLSVQCKHINRQRAVIYKEIILWFQFSGLHHFGRLGRPNKTFVDIKH